MIAAGLVLASAAVLRAAEPHNGGFAERLVEPAAGTKPHVLWLLIDDYGWAELGAHRSPPSPCAPHGHPLALFAAAALCSAAARCARSTSAEPVRLQGGAHAEHGRPHRPGYSVRPPLRL